MIDMYAAGHSVYVIVPYLNSTRMKPPGGGVWTRQAVIAVLKAAGVYAPQTSAVTPLDSVAFICKMARERPGIKNKPIITALTAAGLKTAKGGPWRDTTVRRIRAKHGLADALIVLSNEDRFRRNSETSPSGCVLWTCRLHADGYGHLELIEGRNTLAHRWAYEQRHGTLETGAQLHHVCHNPACVRVEHLVPVSATTHRQLHKLESALVEGIASGAFQDEAKAAQDLDWAAWPPAENSRRIGSLHADEVGARASQLLRRSGGLVRLAVSPAGV